MPEQKQQLAMHSKHVAACVTELVQTAEAMKGDIHKHTLAYAPTHFADQTLLVTEYSSVPLSH